MEEYFNSEMHRYSRKMKEALVPIMEEIYDIHNEDVRTTLLAASTMDAFISFMYEVLTPENITPDMRYFKIKEMLDYFMVNYCEKEIIKQSTTK